MEFYTMLQPLFTPLLDESPKSFLSGCLQHKRHQLQTSYACACGTEDWIALISLRLSIGGEFTPDLVRKYGYPFEVHHVTTDDGYILELHRIPHGRDANNDPTVSRPVALVMHGLLCSSSAWILSGPGSAFGYILAEAGYDVWMGNVRGTTYSRRHLTLDPDDRSNTRFWEYSWEQHGQFDLPAMIDYALEVTGKEKLHYLGHSMGTTMFFTMGSLRPEYNSKIISMHALAPVAYMAHNQSPLLNFISPHANNIERLASLLGIGELLGNSDIATWAGQNLCSDEAEYQEVCSNLLFLIGGWNVAQHNATILPIIMGQMPAGASVRQLAHYGQGIAAKDFRRYDFGTRIANWLAYRADEPPRFDLSLITSPVFLHYSLNDPLAEVPDVERLYRELGSPVGMIRVPNPEFSHLDFMWAIDAKTLLFDRIIDFMQSMDSNTFKPSDVNKYTDV